MGFEDCVGVYVHFPYCSARCPYCDFAIHVRKTIPHARYRDAVIAELAARRDELGARVVRSIYFGGGTPGLWQADCVADVIAAVGGAPREVTLEMNPGDRPRQELGDQLGALRRAGVDRLSIGAQSFSAARLAALGRWHRPEDTAHAVAAAREAGFARLSVDLIFSLPHQTLEELDRELDALLALGTEHVSVYCLTIEPHTAYAALHKRGALTIPDDEQAARLYERVIARLEDAGLAQYEVSSFARAGHEAIHNSLYWTGAPYVGLGSSASSLRLLDGGVHRRDKNVKNVDQYLAAMAGRGARVAERDDLDRAAAEREAVWLGLRLVRGVDRAAHAARFGVDPVTSRQALIDRLTRAGLLLTNASHLCLTPRGRLVADAVAEALL